VTWIVALLLLGVGVGAGMLLSHHLGDARRQTRELREELERARDEHASYRREVSEHFTRTALAVNDLTESYRTVHRHLSDGARQLCDNAAAESALAFDQTRLIDGAEAPATGTVKATTEPPGETTPEEQAAEMAKAGSATDEATAEQAPDVTTDADAAGESRPESTDPAPDHTESGDPEPLAATAEEPVPPRDYAEEPGDTAGNATRH
jgi:uncharacterized membrane-anchored protein YhcB (DUF1043 family)